MSYENRKSQRRKMLETAFHDEVLFHWTVFNANIPFAIGIFDLINNIHASQSYLFLWNHNFTAVFSHESKRHKKELQNFGKGS